MSETNPKHETGWYTPNLFSVNVNHAPWNFNMTFHAVARCGNSGFMTRAHATWANAASLARSLMLAQASCTQLAPGVCQQIFPRNRQKNRLKPRNHHVMLNTPLVKDGVARCWVAFVYEKVCFAQALDRKLPGATQDPLCISHIHPQNTTNFQNIHPLPEKNPSKHAVHSIFCISLNQPSLGRQRWNGNPWSFLPLLRLPK